MTLVDCEAGFDTLSDSDKLLMGKYCCDNQAVGGNELLLAEYAYDGLVALDKTAFLAAELAMLIADAETEAWAESCYAGLSAPDKALFQTATLLHPETLQGGKDLFDMLGAGDKLTLSEYTFDNLGGAKATLCAYIGTDISQAVWCEDVYAAMTGGNKTTFLAAILAMLITDASTEAWAETCYSGLGAIDQATFQTNMSLHPETLAGCEALFDALVIVPSDKLDMAVYAYNNCGAPAMFLTSISAMLIVDASTEAWAETCYTGLSGMDKATFQLNMVLYPQDESSCEMIYGALSAPDKTLFQTNIGLYPETWSGCSNLYAHLSAPDKTLFRADNYLFDLSAAEISAGFLLLWNQMDACMGLIQAGLLDYMGVTPPLTPGVYEYKYQLTEGAYAYTDAAGKTLANTQLGLMLVTDAQTEAWCESCYAGLSAPDKVIFNTAESLMTIADASTEAWAETCYTGLSAPDKLIFQASMSLYDGTLQGGKDIFDILADGDQLQLGVYCYDNMSAPNKVTFLAAESAMLIADASTEAWAETCYAGLSAPDKVIFNTAESLYTETFAGLVALYTAIHGGLSQPQILGITEAAYADLDRTNINTFLAWASAMLIVDASTEAWCETCYTGLSAPDKIVFMTAEGLMGVDLAGVEAGYAGLGLGDKATFRTDAGLYTGSVADVGTAYTALSAGDKIIFNTAKNLFVGDVAGIEAGFEALIPSDKVIFIADEGLGGGGTPDEIEANIELLSGASLVEFANDIRTDVNVWNSIYGIVG